MRTFVEISKQAFYHNINELKKLSNGSSIAAVIKSNGYGHGLLPMATLCKDHMDIHMVCVAHAEEALELHEQGIHKQILTLAYVVDHFEDLIQRGIHITVYDHEMLHKVRECAQKLRKQALIHLKIDTGMNRLGLTVDQVLAIVAQQDPMLTIIGVSTHLNDKDASDLTYTHEQLKIFNNAVAQLPQRLITHALSSGALDLAQQYQYDMARIGTHLYGFWPSQTSKERAQKIAQDISLKPIATWKCSIAQIKTISKNAYVGYGRTFKAEKDMTIAIIPIGYWDGYPRSLSNKGIMYIRHYPAPVIGIVSMNLIALDISHIPDISYDDEVSIYGSRDTARIDHEAQAISTLNIDLTTRINPSVPRIIVG